MDVAWLARRGAATAVLCVVVATLSFALLEALPGGPLVDRDPAADPARLAAQRAADGLDAPLISRYARWLGDVARGDLGVSLSRRRSVARLVAERLPATLALAFSAIAIEVLCALPLAVACARRRGSALDRLCRGATAGLYSLPTFWTGLLAIRVVTVELRMLPAGGLRSLAAAEAGPLGAGLDAARHLVLPSLVLGATAAGGLFRLARNELLDALESPFVLAARARGVPESGLAWRHALPAAAAPVLQALAVSLPSLLSGALVTEVVFGWPGLGRLCWEAFLARDRPVLLGCTLATALVAVAAALAADLAQAAIDPRVRHD